MKTAKTIGSMVLTLILSAVIGTALLCAAYALPTEAIDANVRKSAEVMEQEGTYPTLFSWCLSTLDNFTDSYMLIEAADPSEGTVLEKALANRPGIGTRDPRAVLTEYALRGGEFPEGTGYTRYWHGYEIWLKPLLCMVSYSGIRIVNGFFQAILAAAVCLLLFRRRLQRVILPFLLTWAMLMPLALEKSMQFSACFDVAALGIIGVLSVRREKAHYTFLLIGIATAYFDFLTYPVFTFGMAAVVYFAAGSRKNAGESLKAFLRIVICWGIGYAGMWALKWVLAALVTHQDVFADAIGQLKVRTSDLSQDDVTHVSVFECIARNIQWFLRTPVTALCGCYAVWKGILFLQGRAAAKDIGSMQTQPASVLLRSVLPYMLVALVPIVWFAVTINHSYMHIFYACKTLGISVFAVLVWIAETGKTRLGEMSE